MQNPPSPIETLRQLKEMLDAGTITPAEFETLKQQLIFNNQSSAASSTGDSAILDVPPLHQEMEPVTGLAETSPVAPISSDPSLWESSPEEAIPPVAGVPMSEDEMEGFEEARPRNPLNLVLSIGGLLALLGLVLYLSFNNRSSEHLTSNSKTAADSVATAIEVGPQAEQIEQTVAEPETVRLAPANPPQPVTPPLPATDSAAAVPAATDSVAP